MGEVLRVGWLKSEDLELFEGIICCFVIIGLGFFPSLQKSIYEFEQM